MSGLTRYLNRQKNNRIGTGESIIRFDTIPVNPLNRMQEQEHSRLKVCGS